MRRCFTKLARRLGCIATLGLVLMTVGTASARAQASVTLETDHGPVGMEVMVKGSGWPARTTVWTYFESNVVDGPVATNTEGGFTTTFCVPNRPPGLYPVSFTDGRANFAPSFTITAGNVSNPSPACQKPTTCKPAFFVGLRGSGDSPGADGLGDTVRSFYNKFETVYGKSNVDGYGIPYPAIAVPNFAGARNPVELNNMLLAFGGSVAEGVAKLEKVLVGLNAACPDQRFVIVGYSQGAWAVGEVLAGLDQHGSILLSRITAVVLLGDPKLWWRAPNFEGFATKFPLVSGWLPSGGGPRQPRYMPGVTDWNISPSQLLGTFQFRSYCMDQDPICNATRLSSLEALLPGVPDSEGTTEWKTWLYFCQNEDSRKPVFCQHFMYDKGSLPEEVANWFVERLGQSANIPAAPSDISLAIVSGGTGIGVSWKDNSNNEAGFDIFNGVNHVLVSPNQTFLSSDWGGLSHGQRMCFQVSSYNNAGSSAPTPSTCIMVP